MWVSESIKNTSPWDWWAKLLKLEPLLAPLAMKILQIAIASSSCERHFSRWAHMVSKYRTRLSLTRQHKLIYCGSNWKLLENYDTDKWYRSDSEDDL